MRYESAVIPLRAAWSSHSCALAGGGPDVSSLDLAHQATARALEEQCRAA